jgi:hypothetical protein
MHIKKFTQFIVENEHYSSINEGDIVPGVPFNSTSSLVPGKLSVTSDKKITTFRISNVSGENRTVVNLDFYPSSDPMGLFGGNLKAYACVTVTKNGDVSYPAVVTKMEDLDASKSSSLARGANSIDLLAEFMSSAGIVRDATAGTNLAKVIATLLLNPKYNTQVTDTFKKFANNIIMNVRNRGFILRMSAEYVTVKQSPGMKAFGAQLPESCDALSTPKTADAAKK